MIRREFYFAVVALLAGFVLSAAVLLMFAGGDCDSDAERATSVPAAQPAGRVTRTDVDRLNDAARDATEAAFYAEIEAAGGFKQWKAAMAAEDVRALQPAVFRAAHAPSREEEENIRIRLQAIATKRAVPLPDVYRRAVDALTWLGGEWDYKTGGRTATVSQAIDAVDASYQLLPPPKFPAGPAGIDAYRGDFRWDGVLSAAWPRR